MSIFIYDSTLSPRKGNHEMDSNSFNLYILVLIILSSLHSSENSFYFWSLEYDLSYIELLFPEFYVFSCLQKIFYEKFVYLFIAS